VNKLSLVIVFVVGNACATDAKIQKYIKQLHHQDAGQVINAAQRLSRMKEAVPELIKLLNGKPTHTVKYAVYALEGIGPDSKNAIPKLIPLLKNDSKHGIHHMASKALASIGPDSVPAVLEAFQADSTSTVHHNAWIALCSIAKKHEEAVKAFADSLSHADPKVRRNAARGLASAYANSRSAVPALTKALNDQDKEVRKYAKIALGHIGPTDKAQDISAVVSQLKSKDEKKRLDAVQVLYSWKARGIPGLIEALGNDRKTVRLKAADSLAIIGKAASPAISKLAQIAGRDRDQSVRIRAIGAIAATGKPGVSKLLELLKSAQNGSREQNALVDALQYVGPGAASAGDKLVSIAVINNYARPNAIMAIKSMGEKGVPFLIKAMRSNDWNVRYQAVRCLRDLEAYAVPALSRLRDLVKEAKSSKEHYARGIIKDGETLVKRLEARKAKTTKGGDSKNLVGKNHCLPPYHLPIPC